MWGMLEVTKYKRLRLPAFHFFFLLFLKHTVSVLTQCNMLLCV